MPKSTRSRSKSVFTRAERAHLWTLASLRHSPTRSSRRFRESFLDFIERASHGSFERAASWFPLRRLSVSEVRRIDREVARGIGGDA